MPQGYVVVVHDDHALVCSVEELPSVYYLSGASIVKPSTTRVSGHGRVLVPVPPRPAECTYLIAKAGGLGGSIVLEFGPRACMLDKMRPIGKLVSIQGDNVPTCLTWGSDPNERPSIAFEELEAVASAEKWKLCESYTSWLAVVRGMSHADRDALEYARRRLPLGSQSLRVVNWIYDTGGRYTFDINVSQSCSRSRDDAWACLIGAQGSHSFPPVGGPSTEWTDRMLANHTLQVQSYTDGQTEFVLEHFMKFPIGPCLLPRGYHRGVLVMQSLTKEHFRRLDQASRELLLTHFVCKALGRASSSNADVLAYDRIELYMTLAHGAPPPCDQHLEDSMIDFFKGLLTWERAGGGFMAMRSFLCDESMRYLTPTSHGSHVRDVADVFDGTTHPFFSKVLLPSKRQLAAILDNSFRPSPIGPFNETTVREGIKALTPWLKVVLFYVASQISAEYEVEPLFAAGEVRSRPANYLPMELPGVSRIASSSRYLSGYMWITVPSSSWTGAATRPFRILWINSSCTADAVQSFKALFRGDSPWFRAKAGRKGAPSRASSRESSGASSSAGAEHAEDAEDAEGSDDEVEFVSEETLEERNKRLMEKAIVID